MYTPASGYSFTSFHPLPKCFEGYGVSSWEKNRGAKVEKLENIFNAIVTTPDGMITEAMIVVMGVGCT